MTDQPLVSIVICSYNAGHYLRESVLSITGQTYQNLEILLIDDGSTDGSLATIADIEDPRLRRLRQNNAGRAVALNRALRVMHGDLYATQDADDMSHPQRIERQVRCISEQPDVAAVFCGHELILDDRRIAPRSAPRDAGQCRREIDAFRLPAQDPTGMFRMSLIGEMRYEPSLRIGAAYDYILRIGERHPMVVLGECLYSYRVHSEAVTRQDPSRRQAFVGEVYRRACQRRGIEPAGDSPPRRPVRSRHAQRDNNLPAHFMESVLDLRRSGHRGEAIRSGLACASLHPLDPHYHKALAYALAPKPLIEWLRPALR